MHYNKTLNSMTDPSDQWQLKDLNAEEPLDEEEDFEDYLDDDMDGLENEEDEDEDYDDYTDLLDDELEEDIENN